MKKHLITEKGKFYKANFHCHSTISDGRNTPEEYRDYYKAHGYQILAITDHELLVDHSDLSTDDFLMVTGYEYAILEDADYLDAKTVELNLYPLDPHNEKHICFNPKNVWHGETWRCDTAEIVGEIYDRKLTIESIQHVIDEARKNGFIVSLNHPAYSIITPEFFGQLKGLFAMEIVNQGSFYLSNDYNPQMYQQMLSMGHKIGALATDDNHRAEVYDDKVDKRPWGVTMIKAESLTHKAVMEALQSRNYYASQGPEIYELYTENGEIVITCEEVKTIIMHTKQRHYREKIAPVGEFLTEARFEIPDDAFVWFEIVDAFGRRANTNAYFKEEFC
jgi:hypothetical protein